MIGFNNSLSSVSSMNFDYRTAQLQMKAAMIGQKKNLSGLGQTGGTQSNSTTVQTLKKDTAAYLDKYIADMEKVKDTAGALAGGGAAKILAGEAGSDPAKNIASTVTATQEMVDAYNKALATTTAGSGRGSGSGRQAERMAKPLASESSLGQAGITRKADGTLALDKKALTAALTGDKKDLTTDVLSSIAGSAKRVAADGLSQSPQNLINYDLAVMKQLQNGPQYQGSLQLPQSNAYDSMNLYAKNGAFNMMNMGTIGYLMNTTA
ncbi:MAG: hypothetical protein RR639_02345 [Hydrogenoanaerobacterium sp.]